jgi:Asp/Glu/hydantoin racemase
MPTRLAFVHTVTSLHSVFTDLCRELIPGADLFHVVDESLLQNTIRNNRLTKPDARRLLGYLVSAQEAGAQAAMVTCSSMGMAVEWSRNYLDIPVFRVDEPMVEMAIRIGARIGVAATLQTTMNPTVELIHARAATTGKEVKVTTRLCEGAFAAVMAGNTARHDALVTEGLRDLLSTSDVIVLAQASMARIANNMPAELRQIPILSSPRLAVEHLASVGLD